MNIAVLLSGKLKADGYGRGKPQNGDGTLALDLNEGSTVREVIRALGVPAEKIVLTMVNGRQCDAVAKVKADDRVILIPPDVAALWRAFGTLNMGMDSVFSF